MLKWISNLAGDSNERDLQRIDPIIKVINDLEPAFEKLTNGQ